MNKKKRLKFARALQEQGLLPVEWGDETLGDLEDEDIQLALTLAEAERQDRQTREKLMFGAIGLFFGISLFG